MMREHEIKGLTLKISQRWGHRIELLLLGYSQYMYLYVCTQRKGWVGQREQNLWWRGPTSSCGGTSTECLHQRCWRSKRNGLFSSLREGFSPTLASWRTSTSFKSSKRPWVREDRPSCSSARNWTTRRSGKFWPAMIQRLRRRLPASSCSLWCTSRSLRRNWCSKLM